MKLSLYSPWAKAAIPPADRAAITDRIPDGYVVGLVVAADHRRYRAWVRRDDVEVWPGAWVLAPNVAIARAIEWIGASA